MTQLSNHGRWAMRYVEVFNWHIFPLRPRTKEPFGGLGVYNATNNLDQIWDWWRWQPNANIGWHPGADGCLALDADRYKDAYRGDNLLTLSDQETTTNLTGSGGIHLVWKMPDGELFGNATKGLPAGIDIRGWGGYIVLPPSIHPNGRRYQWELGYGPHELPPQPLPGKLYTTLKAAQSKSCKDVFFSDVDTEKPDLHSWPLRQSIRRLIMDGHKAGADRSKTDWVVIAGLIRAGAGDDDIRAVYQHYPIGTAGKYAEKRAHADTYLKLAIGKLRAELEQCTRRRCVVVEVSL